MEFVFSPAPSLRRKAAWFHANGVWGGSGGRAGGGECGTAAVGNQATGPAQQVSAQAGEQEAVSGDPADGFEHGQGAADGSSACARKRRIQNWPRSSGIEGDAVWVAPFSVCARSRRAMRNRAIT